jgi:hypothetical protein
VAGNQLTEVSDLLGPYEVLAASGEFNVYVVAAERKPAPLNPLPLYLCCAWVDIVPHYSFARVRRDVRRARPYRRAGHSPRDPRQP